MFCRETFGATYANIFNQSSYYKFNNINKNERHIEVA